MAMNTKDKSALHSLVLKYCTVQLIALFIQNQLTDVKTESLKQIDYQ